MDEAGTFVSEKYGGGAKGNGDHLGYRDGSMNDHLLPPRPPSIIERRATPLSAPATPPAVYGNVNTNMNAFSPVAMVGAPPSLYPLGPGPIPSPYEYEYPPQNTQYPYHDGFGAPPVPGMHGPAPYGTYTNQTPPGSPFAGGYAYNSGMFMGMAMGGATSTPPPLPRKISSSSLPDPFASPVSSLSGHGHNKDLPLPPLSPPPSLPIPLPSSPLRMQTQLDRQSNFEMCSPTLSINQHHQSEGGGLGRSLTTLTAASASGSSANAGTDNPSRNSSYSTSYSEAQVSQAVKVQVHAMPLVYEELKREKRSSGDAVTPPPPAGSSPVAEPPASATTNKTTTEAEKPAPEPTQANEKRPMSAYTLYNPEDAYGGM